MAAALNRLAGRIEELLAAERETVADLSHRLRTPLTAVRLDVEALPGPRQGRLESDVAQVERTLTGVIHAARRLDRAAARPGEAVAVVRERFDFWSALLEEQDRARRSWSTREPDTVVAVAAEDLAAALDALLANTAAHTPDGTRGPGASCGVGGTDVVVDVGDQGPGIPESALVRGPQRPRLDRSRPRHRPLHRGGLGRAAVARARRRVARRAARARTQPPHTRFIRDLRFRWVGPHPGRETV